MRWLILLAGLHVLLPVSGETQELLPPSDLPTEIQIPLEQMKFDRATKIEGRVLYLDTYDDALWIPWTAVHDGIRWHTVPSGRQFVVYPTSSDMMTILKVLPKGTVLRMTVQRGPDGKRRVLVLEGT